MVTKEGIRADPEKVQTIIQSPTPKSLNQIRSYFLQLKAISKFIPKLVELKYPIREVRMRFETTEGSGWTNEAEESLRRIKRKLNKLQALAITICYTPMEKMVHALIHTIRSLRTIFRKHKVTVVTDRPMEEILKLPGRDEQLAKWDAEAQIYDISKHQMQMKGKAQPKQEASIKINLNTKGMEVLPGQRNNQIRFGCRDNPRLAASVSKGMKDLHVFINSLTLVAKIEGNHTPTMEQERKYKEEIINATAPFHMFRITYLPKILNSKAEVLTGLATIKLEFLNQEVSVSIKTRPSVEETSSSKEEKSASNVPRIKPNYNWGTSRSN
ncbi:hypothetical protein Tco_1207370 [Tanacetum coccineum]